MVVRKHPSWAGLQPPSQGWTYPYSPPLPIGLVGLLAVGDRGDFGVHAESCIVAYRSHLPVAQTGRLAGRCTGCVVLLVTG